MLKFALIGDGTIAKYHKEAIKHVGGEIKYIFDPKHVIQTPSSKLLNSIALPSYVDYAVILSPSHLHRSQMKEILESGRILKGIICEKPAFLPWELPIDNDKINIVLQLRYLPNLPEKADLVSVRFVRDEAYFKSWKGDARNTGGLFYNLFIHYIYLAQMLGADFKGLVSNYGHQERWVVINDNKFPREFGLYSNPIDEGANSYSGLDQFYKEKNPNIIDILNIDNQSCYNKLYEDIINGKGIKPSSLFYLNWILNRNSEMFGYGRNGLNKAITIKNELM